MNNFSFTVEQLPHHPAGDDRQRIILRWRDEHIVALNRDEFNELSALFARTNIHLLLGS